MESLWPVIALLIAFISGSFPTALLMGKMKGVDLRKVGSGNIGATNAFRALGKWWGIACLAIDAFKGWAPATWLAAWMPASIDVPTRMLLLGLAAIAGHSFSPWLKFKGGKGVATSLGVFLAVAPIPVLILFGVGVALIAATGYVSLASITGAALLPILIILLPPHGQRPWAVIALAAALGVFVIWKHRANIQRLRDGTENKLFKKKD